MTAWHTIFKDEDLDTVFVVTYAPGQSAFNLVERRMASLSHDLTGLILPYDSFGNHLDKKKGRTIDPVLEERNYQRAGKLLGEVWPL